MKYKLSICMMVKNEELHLERCLNSLEEIIKRHDVELIIVDTGSDDNTVNIAKKYTDKVYYKEWFDDFSGMRNVTISHAKGEYIFILDADEIIENPKMVIDFIENKDKRKIKTFFLKVKNYTNLIDTNLFATMVSPRIFLNDGNFRYEGSVHNQPIFKQPTDVLNVFLGHFGYITSDKRIMDKKFNRTVTLLKKELEIKPYDIYYLIQLATSYNMHGDIYESYKISKETYNLILTKDIRKQLESYAIFSVHIFNCLALGNYTETIEVCERAIKLRDDYIDAYFNLAFAYEKLGNLDMSESFALKFLELINNFYELPISKDDGIIIYRNDNSTVKRVKLFLAGYYYNRKNYFEAIKYLDIEEFEFKNINIYISVYLESDSFDLLYDLLKNIKNDDRIKFFQTIEENILKYEDDKRQQIRKLFIDIDDDYSLYCEFKLLPDKEVGNKLGIAKKIFKNMSGEYGTIYNADILAYICNSETLSLTLFNKFMRQGIFYYIDYFYNNRYSDVYLKVFDWINNIDIIPYGLRNEFTLKYIFEAIVIRVSSEYKSTGINSVIKDNLSIFHNYLNVGLQLIEKIYSLEGINLKYEYMTDLESKFLILIYLYRKSIERNNIKAAFIYYKLAAETYPEMADFLKIYLGQEFNDNLS